MPMAPPTRRKKPNLLQRDVRDNQRTRRSRPGNARFVPSREKVLLLLDELQKRIAYFSSEVQLTRTFTEAHQRKRLQVSLRRLRPEVRVECLRQTAH